MQWLGHADYRPDHTTAQEILAAHPDAWVFGVLRDPFDRLVSEYHYRYPRRGVDYFRKGLHRFAGLTNSQHWCAHRILKGARWVPFNDLENSLRTLLTEAGIEPPSEPLPNVRDSSRPPLPFLDYYDAASRELVEKGCAWEIEELRKRQ